VSFWQYGIVLSKGGMILPDNNPEECFEAKQLFQEIHAVENVMEKKATPEIKKAPDPISNVQKNTEKPDFFTRYRVQKQPERGSFFSSRGFFYFLLVFIFFAIIAILIIFKMIGKDFRYLKTETDLIGKAEEEKNIPAPNQDTLMKKKGLRRKNDTNVNTDVSPDSSDKSDYGEWITKEDLKYLQNQKGDKVTTESPQGVTSKLGRYVKVYPQNDKNHIGSDKKSADEMLRILQNRRKVSTGE
jgi:hypothetical protein